MCKDIYSILDYPKEFFNKSLNGITDTVDPLPLSHTMSIVNSVFECFHYEKDESQQNSVSSESAEVANFDEAGSERCLSNPLAKFNQQFTLHIKNETLESEGNIYDQQDEEMNELDWERLNDADEEEYLDMLDQREEEYKSKIKGIRKQEYQDKKRKEEEEFEKQEAEDLQEL